MELINILLDFSLLSFLLFIGFLLRYYIPLFQRIMLPASIIGGLVGLALGPQILGLIPYSATLSEWPGILICIVFTCMLFGFRFKGGRTFLPQVCIKGILFQGQVVIGMGIAIALVSLYALPEPFGMIGVFGFYGGHGTAAAVGGAWESYGWGEGLPLCMVTATAGIISGIILGMVGINYAARKGYCKYVEKPSKLSIEIRRGYVPKEKREPIGEKAVVSEVIDPLLYQFCFIGMGVGLGYLIKLLLVKINPIFDQLPWYAATMIGGLIIWLIILKLKREDLVDLEIIKRIEGASLDFLIVSAIATLPLYVVLKYAFPLVLIIIASVAYTFGTAYFFSKKLYKRDWFERGIGDFGQAMGVMATGLLLVRVVDPEFKSLGSQGLAISYFLWYPIFLIYIILGPIITINHEGALSLFYLSTIFLVALLLIGSILALQYSRNK
jgi:ESS family glutamate:Na+ symporter